ncbi:hypothetical protein STEG23_029298 [Scotinomys teguina]
MLSITYAEAAAVKIDLDVDSLVCCFTHSGFDSGFSHVAQNSPFSCLSLPGARLKCFCEESVLYRIQESSRSLRTECPRSSVQFHPFITLLSQNGPTGEKLRLSQNGPTGEKPHGCPGQLEVHPLLFPIFLAAPPLLELRFLYSCDCECVTVSVTVSDCEYGRKLST